MQRKSGSIDEKDRQEDKYFVCDVCNMREKYHVETDAIKRLELRFLEKVYLIKDGTAEDIGGFAVGSHCSECDRNVASSTRADSARTAFRVGVGSFRLKSGRCFKGLQRRHPTWREPLPRATNFWSLGKLVSTKTSSMRWFCTKLVVIKVPPEPAFSVL
ncbi:unnamed protein product [Ixodes pacificus]